MGKTHPQTSRLVEELLFGHSVRIAVLASDLYRITWENNPSLLAEMNVPRYNRQHDTYSVRELKQFLGPHSEYLCAGEYSAAAFYDYREYCKIVDTVGLDIDTDVVWNRFIDQRSEMLFSEQRVQRMVTRHVNGIGYSTDEFCAYEQAYFETLLEEHTDD